jgi:glycosyltransferase involved in cell wall biosynthesis
MASGAPTVAPNAGGILSYATNENAWLVEPEGEAFASAVREIVADQELCRQKIERALTTARENTREASTDRLFATYDKIAGDFERRRELFIDAKASQDFDFARELLK